ncbi:MAG: YciI family protein [Acidimicrobiales bacterium]
MKYVLFYDSAEDVAENAPLHFPAHRARQEEFRARGTLLMVGTFSNVQDEGSMAIFTTRDAAEEFARGDPFVLHGVVRHWHVRAWNEVLAPS